MKKIFISVFVISSLFLSLPAFSAPLDLMVGDSTLVSKKRVGRTTIEYTYKLDILNNDTVIEAVNVTATLSSTSPKTTVIDGTVEVDSIPASGNVTSTDTFTVRQNRRFPFDPATLVWDVQSASLIEITSPEDGMTAGNPTVIIRGKINGISLTSVRIRSTVEGRDIFSSSIPVQGGNFAFVPALRVGANLVTITATLSSGAEKTETITIYEPSSSTENIFVEGNPETAVLFDAASTVDVSLISERSIKNRIISYSWDFDGDGVADKEGNHPETISNPPEVTATYSKTGMYFPTVTVTDENGDKFTGTAVVNILSVERVNATFQKIVSSLRNSLISGDIDKAVSLFFVLSQDKYREMFESFSPSDRNALAQELGDVRFVKLSGGRAEFEVITTREDGNTYSFPILFVRHDGMWKIKIL